ncbi:MAG TPA: YhjD/YihY/BrkB family envelope integrity protein [Steroidobacteraceae bacterium]
MWVRAWNIFDRLFFGPRSNGAGLGWAIVRVLRYPYAVIRDLFGGEINLRAMGLVYTTLLSLIPLLAISFAILAAFGMSRDLEPIVHEFFRPMGESGAAEITTRVMHFVGRVSNRVVGTVGLAVLLWTLVGTIKKVEDSFNFVWRVQHARSFARRLTEYVSLLIIGPILMVGFLALSHVAMANLPLQDVVNLAPLARLRSAAISIAPYAMVTVFFVVFYMFIPNTRVRLLPALIGGATAGFVWAAVGKVFTNMVVLSTRLTIVYAGFAFIVAALLWTYFGWLILLAGAQLSFYIQNPSYLRLGLRELRLSNIETEQLALKLMYCIAQARAQGAQNWSIHRLAGEFGLPGLAVTRIACTLEDAGLLKVSHDDECTLAREPSTIPLQEILSVVRNQKSGDFVAKNTPVPAVDALNRRLEQAWRAACDNESLQDLIGAPTPVAP